MGCFNVACSVSNVSIGYGDDIAFIFLKAKKDYRNRKENQKLPNTHMFLDTTVMYEPAFLPIFGKYNDYGGIDHIEKDLNTDFLEKRFGISIEDMSSIVCSSDSGIELIMNFMPQFNVKKFSYSDRVNEENLLNCNFSQVVENVYSLNDSDLTLFLAPEEDGGFIEVSRNDVIKKYSSSTDMRDLQEDIFNDFNIIISISRSDEKKALNFHSIFSELSGMFVHRSIFDMMTSGNLSGNRFIGDNMNSSPYKILIEKLGFVKDVSDENGTIYEKEGVKVSFARYGRGCEISGANAYTMKEFFENCPLDLDKSLIANFDASFENYLDLLNPLKNAPKKENNPNYDVEILKWTMDLNRSKEDLGFRDMRYLSQTYFEMYGKEEISLGKNLFDFRLFCSKMYSMNRFFAPAMNGEQHGNSRLSKMLFQKSLMIENAKSEDDDYNVVNLYMFSKDIDEAKEVLLECIEDYSFEEAVDASGLSRFEIDTFIKDNSKLIDILDSYCT